MDPTTTLVTFFLETDPSVKSVQLIGSWDNFSSCNTMHRDVRRGRGQWRACHSLPNSNLDNTTSTTPKATNGGTPNGCRTLIKAAATGGLNMGNTYYYYYEVDGSTETYNPSLPSTTNCPYLPGQTVNIINVPVEQRLRLRSASLSSLRYEAFKTMNPNDRFITPKPTSDHTAFPSVPHRLATAFTPPVSRSPSPTPSHSWKRFFKRPCSRTDLRGRSSILEHDDHHLQYEHDIHMQTQSFTSAPSSTFYIEGSSRCGTPTEGTRTRDISPESLRRFLVDDAPTSRPGSDHRPHCLTIPEDIAEEAEAEVDDDDDNFATSAISESFPIYTTRLSPPPSQRSDAAPPPNASSATITQQPQQPTLLPKLSIQASFPTTLLSLSPDSSAYDSDEADSRFISNPYSLPSQSYDIAAKNPVMSPTLAGNSPPLLPHATIDTGVDFASEFAWMNRG